MAKTDAQMAYEEALQAKTASENTRMDLEKLLNKISDFLDTNGAKPEEVQKVRLTLIT